MQKGARGMLGGVRTGAGHGTQQDTGHMDRAGWTRLTEVQMNEHDK